MGVTGLKKCYFFVFTVHGYVIDEIDFEKDYFKDFCSLCSKFYTDFYLSSIFQVTFSFL